MDFVIMMHVYVLRVLWEINVKQNMDL